MVPLTPNRLGYASLHLLLHAAIGRKSFVMPFPFRYGNIQYFHRAHDCSAFCTHCKAIGADNFYNSLVISRPSNRSALIDEFYANNAATGASCDFDERDDPLRGRVLQRFFISDLCRNECFYGCVRHAPTYEERRTLLEQDLKGILLYECAPFPLWIIVVCVAVFVVIAIVIMIVTRALARRKSNKDSERKLPEAPASAAEDRSVPMLDSLESTKASGEAVSQGTPISSTPKETPPLSGGK